jgi:hypothetical protein
MLEGSVPMQVLTCGSVLRAQTVRARTRARICARKRESRVRAFVRACKRMHSCARACNRACACTRARACVCECERARALVRVSIYPCTQRARTLGDHARAASTHKHARKCVPAPCRLHGRRHGSSLRPEEVLPSRVAASGGLLHF